jgi:hypothetical protein
MSEAVPPFANVEQLESGWRTMNDSEQAKAKVLLARASRKIRSTCPGWEAAERHEPGLCADICCAMVQRAMSMDDVGLPAGISQANETTGPFSNGYTFSNPLGDLYLLDSEKKSLGMGQGKAFVVGMRRGK